MGYETFFILLSFALRDKVLATRSVGVTVDSSLLILQEQISSELEMRQPRFKSTVSSRKTVQSLFAAFDASFVGLINSNNH